MKNENFYKKKVQEASETKYDISEQHSPVMRNISKMFKMVYGENPKKFNTVKNMLFYTGGYPTPNSPAKLEVLLEQFISSYIYLSILKKDGDFVRTLANNGIKISIDESLLKDGSVDLYPKQFKKFIKMWKQVYGDDEVPKSKHELLNLLMDKALNEQRIINEMNDQIKVIDAEQVQQECEVEKPYFMKAVSLKYKTLKNKPIEDDIKKIEDTPPKLQEAIIDLF